MKKPLLILLPILLLYCTTNNKGQTMKEQIIIKQQENIDKTYIGPQEHFTGKVTIRPIFDTNSNIAASSGYVTFEPGARSAWHTHPVGQNLIITKGKGLTVEENGTVSVFQEGDTIICPPHIRHWHGATPDSSMTHIAITGVKDGKVVDWMEKVTDEEYNTAVSQISNK